MSGPDAAGRHATGDGVVAVRVDELGGTVPPGAALRLVLLVDGPADAGSAPIGEAIVRDWDGGPISVLIPYSTDHGDGDDPTDVGRTVFAHLGRSEHIQRNDWLTTVAYPVVADSVSIRLDYLP